jgi:hypothetical protein
MKSIRGKQIGQLLALATLATVAGGVQAQTAAPKEKEAMYSYVSLWAVPRAKWTEFEKPVPAEQKILDQSIADGTLVGYGDDTDLVHSADGYTHDNWWSSHSMAGVLKVLDAFEKLPSTTGGALATVTKHEDHILVSHHYNWKAGSYKDGYTHAAYYRLKQTAPEDATDALAKNAFEPLLEKLLADGTIVEYEVDEEAIHTEDPNGIWLSYAAPNAEGLDKVNKALVDFLKANALVGPAFDSMIDSTPHRDFLARSNLTYK